MKAKAIDISYCQTGLNYASLRAKGVEYAIIKASEGMYTDRLWETHVRGCVSAGINIGAYSFIVASNVAEAKAHAQKFIQSLDMFRGRLTCPVYADMESGKYDGAGWTKESRTKILTTFLEEVRKAGYYAAVYINPAWLENYIDKSQIIGKYDIWLAAWTEDPNRQTRWNYGQTVWQWGLDKTLGIPGGVDGDLVFVDYPTKIKQLGLNHLNGAPTPTPASEKVKEVRLAMQSMGEAAIRKTTTKAEANPPRVEKGKIYLFDGQIKKPDGTLWLKHAGQNLYSMYKDGKILFQSIGSYTIRRTTNDLKVRQTPCAAKNDSNKIGFLSKGAAVYVLDEKPIPADGYSWVKIIYKNSAAYVAAEYLTN